LSEWWESSDIPLFETNEVGENLLNFAARRGHRPICEVLLKRGMDINLLDGSIGSPLAAAATSSGNIEVVNYLIEQDADVNLPL
jgi:ankyrin repeat protein